MLRVLASAIIHSVVKGSVEDVSVCSIFRLDFFSQQLISSMCAAYGVWDVFV